MTNVSFTIGRTRNGVFTKDQLAKVQAGLDIYLKCVNHKQFKNKLLSYEWYDTDDVRYNRFHLCKALSNKQVYECFEQPQGAFGTKETPITIAILPCETRKDIHGYTKMSVPTIWLNKGCLHHDWYTAVHVASCIAHEYCINLGFQAGIGGGLVPQFEHTVPYACGHIIKEVAAQWQNNVSDIRDSFDQMDDNGYEYLPCSTTFQLKGMKAEADSCNQAVKDFRKILKAEAKVLKKQEELSAKEFERLCALEKSIYKLKKIQAILKKTSLDGMETISINTVVKKIAENE